MRGSDFFDLYRQMLAVVVGSYTCVAAVGFLWRWAPLRTQQGRAHRMVRRYVIIHLLRVSVSRFTPDLVQVAALLAALILLIWLHWQLR